jgi:hypothetical protein
MGSALFVFGMLFWGFAPFPLGFTVLWSFSHTCEFRNEMGALLFVFGMLFFGALPLSPLDLLLLC